MMIFNMHCEIITKIKVTFNFHNTVVTCPSNTLIQRQSLVLLLVTVDSFTLSEFLCQHNLTDYTILLQHIHLFLL